MLFCATDGAVTRRNNHTERGELIDTGGLAADLAEAAAVLEAVTQVVVDRKILDRAGALEAPMVRTLDAIHLATALELQASTIQFVTYDRRLAAVVRQAGLAAVSPR